MKFEFKCNDWMQSKWNWFHCPSTIYFPSLTITFNSNSICARKKLDDDNRVVLQKISGDPHSDYINASYIPVRIFIDIFVTNEKPWNSETYNQIWFQGYLNERAYIATQTPLKSTINDFWRMVWHEKVHVICMLTNVTDTSKVTI